MTNDKFQMTNLRTKLQFQNSLKIGALNFHLSFVICILSFFFMSSSAFAEVEIETSVSRSSLAMGDQLRLDIIISNADGRIERPQIDSIDGFVSYSQGHSQELSIVNGRSTSRSVYSYTLMANSVGTKTIGPFSIVINGKAYKVAPVKVDVTQGGGASASSQYQWNQAPVSAPSSRALPTTNVGDQDIFVKAWLDKDEVFINEPVMLTYTLFTRLSATYKGFEKEPTTTGFWVEDFPPEKTIRRTEKMLNGQRYVVADVRKLALFPTQQGIFTVDPGTLEASVELRSEDSFDSFFSNNIFGGRRYGFPGSFTTQVVPKTLRADTVKITAKALPESGRPKSFSGAVGQYDMEMNVDKTEVEVGDPVTLKVRVWGQGNINTLQTPPLPKMDDFKVYDSSSSTDLSKERLIVEGEKITETVIVPKKPGTYQIPALRFSYFDTKEGSFKEIETSSQTLKVTGSVTPEPAAPVPVEDSVRSVAQEDASVASKDIRYIKMMDDKRLLSSQPLWRKPIYWALNFIFVLIAAIVGLGAMARHSGEKDAKGLRFKRSHSLARGKLKAAERVMKPEKTEAFYGEVSKAVYGYFADKLGIPAQGVSYERVEEYAGHEATAELLNKIRSLFEELSMGRYGRAEKSLDDMKDVYDLADHVITNFEKLRKK